jgi:hypothetical protein
MDDNGLADGALFIGGQRDRLGSAAAKDGAVAGSEPGRERRSGGSGIVVGDGCFDGDGGCGRGRCGPGSRGGRVQGHRRDLRMYEKSIFGDMEVIVFIEPYMPVNAGAFIKPAFILGGIHADGEDIVAAKAQVIGEIAGEAAIAAGVITKIKAVDPNLAVAVYAVEADDKAPA